MVAISLSALAKKAAALLASNKDGRNIIGYVISITVFLLLLALIVLYAMFGWMGGDSDVREQIDLKIDAMVSSDPDRYADEYAAFESIVESAEKASGDSIKTN